MTSAGKKFREALKASSPLQIVGTINAYQALQATKVGHKAIYLSGGGFQKMTNGFAVVQAGMACFTVIKRHLALLPFGNS